MNKELMQYGTQPIKNGLDRFRNNLLGNGTEQQKKTFLITKQDGSQRYFNAFDYEYYVNDRKAIFYAKGQCFHGTTFTNVISVEEMKYE